MEVADQRHVSAALHPRKRPDTLSRGWADPRADLDGYGKSCPHRNSIPGQSCNFLSYNSIQLLVNNLLGWAGVVNVLFFCLFSNTFTPCSLSELTL